jgi:hypothetical protein
MLANRTLSQLTTFVGGMSLIALLASSGGLFSTVQAQTLSNPITTVSSKSPTWADLGESDKNILSPLESDWESLSPDMKQKWVQVAKKYEKLPGTEQERLRSRMSEWSKLSQSERRIARENYLKNMNVTPEKKAEAWQAYQQLSPEEKKKLADEASHKKPSLVNSPSLKSK